MKHLKSILLIFLIVLMFSSALAADKKNKKEKPNTSPQIEIINPEGMRVVYQVEVAKTYQQRAKGLMYRESLGKNNGMFFIFNNMMDHTMWMKNTQIPLDIIFIDDKLKVVGVAENTVPFSESTISVQADSLYALEVNAGQAKKNNIVKGSVVIIKGFVL